MPKRRTRWNTRRAYEFIKAHQREYDVGLMCRVLGVARSGYDAWLKQPISRRAHEDARLLKLIRASYKASHGIYGSPRLFLDLREAGETCSKHRVARLMRVNKIKALHGYRMRTYSAPRPSVVTPDLVKRDFDVIRPNDAVLKAVRARRPRDTIIHSDQGCQYGSDDWHRFCKANRLRPSMSRKGNCWDNAVAESFFASLKKGRIRKRIYKNRVLATHDVADYIDAFYNPARRHRHLGGISPESFESRANAA